MYINPLSESDLTKAILLIQEDQKLKNIMIKKGWEHAQNFSDQKIAKNLMRVYKSL